MLIKKTKNELTMCSGITGLEVEARWKNEQFINWIELLIGGLWVDKEKKIFLKCKRSWYFQVTDLRLWRMRTIAISFEKR